MVFQPDAGPYVYPNIIHIVQIVHKIRLFIHSSINLFFEKIKRNYGWSFPFFSEQSRNSGGGGGELSSLPGCSASAFSRSNFQPGESGARWNVDAGTARTTRGADRGSRKCANDWFNSVPGSGEYRRGAGPFRRSGSDGRGMELLLPTALALAILSSSVPLSLAVSESIIGGSLRSSGPHRSTSIQGNHPFPFVGLLPG